MHSQVNRWEGRCGGKNISDWRGGGESNMAVWRMTKIVVSEGGVGVILPYVHV